MVGREGNSRAVPTAAGAAARTERERRRAVSPTDWTTTDGLVGVYAARVVDRGLDLRPVLSQYRAGFDPTARWPVADDATQSPPAPPGRVGRGTAGHRQAVRQARRGAEPRRARSTRSIPGLLPTSLVARLAEGRPVARVRGGRRLMTAGLAAVLVVVGGVGAALGAEAPRRQDVLPQSGNALDAPIPPGIAGAGVATSAGGGAPLTPTGVVAVRVPAPGPRLSWMAAQLEGTTFSVAATHVVEPGETLAAIADRYGLAPQSLADVNALADPAVLAIGQELLIPGSDAAGLGGPVGTEAVEVMPDAFAPEVGAAPAAAEPLEAFVPNVPAYLQQRSLSCEYAAAYIATSALGGGVPEWVFYESVPQARNPHWGYRGDIDGWWGNTDDYGVYAEALVPTLNANGYAADVFYSFGDPAALRARLDRGQPVLTWLGYWGDTGVVLEDEGVYTVAAGMHVVVAYGYDAWGVHVSNPGRGTYEYYGWDDFTAMWAVLDGMALAVAPL